MAFPVATIQGYAISSGFTGNDNQRPTQPFIIPPEYGSAGFSQPNQVAVGLVGAAGPSFSPSKATFTNNDFVLSWSGTTATLTAGGPSSPSTNVWSVGSQARQNLKANFDTMYQGLEALEYGGQLALGTSIILAQRMAESLPLSLSETLLYRYNFAPTSLPGPMQPQGYIDLLPGMRLRVEVASGLFTNPGSGFNGFAGSGASYWQIRRRRTDQALLFDAFAGVVASYTPTVAVGGAWGLLDLQSAGNARYYRLFYPPSQFAAWPGYAGANENCTLVGTQYLADMVKATQAYTSGQPIPTTGQGPIAATFFRGRANVVPELTIRVNTIPLWVPAGITARQYVETYAIPCFTTQTFIPPQPSPLQLMRIWSPFDVSQSLSVKVTNLVDGAFPNGIDAWDLPLLRGDSVNFN